MDYFSAITAIIGEILDVDPETISPQTYLIRDLGAESIDLLEIGVAVQHRLGLAVDDDQLFLKEARVTVHQAQADGTKAILSALTRAYPHLNQDRLARMPADMENGPALQVADLLAYVRFTAEKGQK